MLTYAVTTKADPSVPLSFALLGKLLIYLASFLKGYSQQLQCVLVRH